MEENKPVTRLTEDEVSTLAKLCKDAFITICKSEPDEAKCKRMCRFAFTHLCSFLSYIPVTVEESNSILNKAIDIMSTELKGGSQNGNSSDRSDEI